MVTAQQLGFGQTSSNIIYNNPQSFGYSQSPISQVQQQSKITYVGTSNYTPPKVTTSSNNMLTGAIVSNVATSPTAETSTASQIMTKSVLPQNYVEPSPRGVGNIIPTIWSGLTLQGISANTGSRIGDVVLSGVASNPYLTALGGAGAYTLGANLILGGVTATDAAVAAGTTGTKAFLPYLIGGAAGLGTALLLGGGKGNDATITPTQNTNPQQTPSQIITPSINPDTKIYPNLNVPGSYNTINQNTISDVYNNSTQNTLSYQINTQNTTSSQTTTTQQSTGIGDLGIIGIAAVALLLLGGKNG